MQVLTTLHRLASKAALPLLVVGFLFGCGEMTPQEKKEYVAKLRKTATVLKVEIAARKADQKLLTDGDWIITPDDMYPNDVAVFLNKLHPDQARMAKISCNSNYDRCYVWYPRCGGVVMCGESGDMPPEGTVVE